MLKNMQHLENFCDVTLVSEDDEMIIAHNLVLASVSSPLGPCSRLMTRILIMNLSIWVEDFQNSWYLSLISRLIGLSPVHERHCEDFLNILKNYKILKVKSTCKTNKIRCSLYNHGFYKAAPGRMFNQPDVYCETHIRVNPEWT